MAKTTKNGITYIDIDLKELCNKFGIKADGPVSVCVGGSQVPIRDAAILKFKAASEDKKPS